MVTLDDYRWLLSDAAAARLQTARELTSSTASPVSVMNRLRKDLTATQAYLVVEQVELRARAAEKFFAADRLFFTKKGLEQATDEWLARYKAGRFEDGENVADVCCGIGGDLLAIAGRGPAGGVDSDPVAVLLAAANLAALGRVNARVDLAEASAANVAGRSAWHCDPDRRASGRRTTQIEHFSPSLEDLNEWLGLAPAAAIKLAPATVTPESWQAAAELEWLGSRRECRQQVAWFGALARHPGKRTATVVQGTTVRTIVEDDWSPPPVATTCGRYVFEPHNAVLAAQLLPTVCHEHELAPLSASVAYLTGDEQIADLAMDAFQVLDVLPFDRKRLRAYCRERRLGRLEIKKRGVAVDPEKLRKEIAASGEESATLIVTPIGKKVHAIVARRAV